MPSLDTPELFWSEASLLPLYEAIRDYLEITARVQLLNDRLSVSGELLEIVHDYIGEGQMEHITMIIIWLIGEFFFHEVERPCCKAQGDESLITLPISISANMAILRHCSSS